MEREPHGVDPELAELDAQWRALEAIGAEGRDGSAETGDRRASALVAAWAAARDWPAGFAKPRLKLPDMATS